MRIRRRLAWLALGLLLHAGAALGAEAPITVLLVRHAEKASGADDPPLSAAGEARARALAHVAGSAGVSAVYHTQYKRTQQTVGPLATKLGLTPTSLPATDTPALVSAILSAGSGHTVLVAGHSNSLPAIVKALTGVAMEDIPDAEYDNLFVVMLPPGGPASLTRIKYGAPTP